MVEVDHSCPVWAELRYYGIIIMVYMSENVIYTLLERAMHRVLLCLFPFIQATDTLSRKKKSNSYKLLHCNSLFNIMYSVYISRAVKVNHTHSYCYLDIP